jgi:hypothetical protein
MLRGGPSQSKQEHRTWHVYTLLAVSATEGPRAITHRYDVKYLYTTGFLKRYLLSRIALRLLKIIKPYLVEQNCMVNAQLLGYGSKHLGQNFFFYSIKKDRCFPEEPERVILKQTPPYNLYGVFPFQPFSPETAE